MPKNLLDDDAIYGKLDPSRCYESVVNLPDQCYAAWLDVKKLEFDQNFSNPRSIVFSGMGGSAYGARIIKSLYHDSVKVPLDLVSDYNLPGYAGPDNLLFAASYSGNTEETVSTINQGIKKGCRIIGISSGGRLADLIKNAGMPVYVFDPRFNPSGQPRLGQGYMQMGQIAIMGKLGFISIGQEEVDRLVRDMSIWGNALLKSVPVKDNQAKIKAIEYSGKIINFIGAEFLEGAVHAIRNPMHETGKHYANYYTVPELNHHLMEGLGFPDFLKSSMTFIIIRSKLYSEKTKKRMDLTEEVIRKNGIEVSEICLKSDTKMGQVFELIQFGSFVSFYLAMVHKVDPSKIPWVDYFKKNL